ncbi:MAG: DEAD/DEAH box helicase family protein [Erysipelotrichaceae bacterium]
MKLQFVDQQYQSDAVNSICDIFDGCEVKDSLFTIDLTNDKYYNKDANLVGEDISYKLGHANKLNIDDSELLNNVRKIQETNMIQKSKRLDSKNFTVEMETGTGKTYVYTKTMLELYKRYGFTKFIIVVPSIAIKEGVYKSLQITENHFKERYDNVIYDYFVYDSAQLNQVQTFATSTNVEIMVINIDAFRKSFVDKEKNNKQNLIHRESDKLSGNKPIDLIAGTNPIVIIDEPQSVDNTSKSKEAIASLNPLFILRYSATHKELYNLMYRLTPVDAYHDHLVKQIEVASITSNEASTKPYVKLISVKNKDGFSARVEIYIANKKTGVIDKKAITVNQGDDLWELSNEVDYYKDKGFIVNNIDCFEGEENIQFTNGDYVNIGESTGDISLDAIKRAQIRQTIQIHLERELHYIKQGIKVLSLFFIDEVSKYRNYEREDEKGDYAVWFEEEYEYLINQSRFKRLKEEFGDQISFNSSDIHDGYFSKDGKGRLKNTTGITASDETTYQLIMKDKEQLLSLKEPIRFIFSHSTLKEGWDNPNVFQICTLIETKDTMTKRQKVGRGLRICVDQNGSRVMDPKYNVLSVIANESYKEFANTLQKELESDHFKFGVIDAISFTGLSMTDFYGEEHELTQDDSENIYNFLKEKEYVKSNGKVAQLFFRDLNTGIFELPEKYMSFTSKVALKIQKDSREIPIRDMCQKTKVNINKEVQLSPEFKALWDKIKQRTFYSIHMDIDQLKMEAIEGIKNMPRIKADEIDGELNKINITQQGVVSESKKEYQLGKISDFEKTSYPDFIRRLQDSTELLRSTIIEVIASSGRLKDFYINPEEFIKQVSSVLLKVKKDNLTKGIEYHKIDNDFYEQDFIFNDEELFGYKDRNIIAVKNNKNIYDHVVYDSEIEKSFAVEAENQDEVLVYAKLPSRFKIDTPIGTYNPDWALVMITDEGEKLYFVAETKGTEDINELKGKEKSKILCGRKHFEVVDSGIRYELVKELKTLNTKV